MTPALFDSGKDDAALLAALHKTSFPDPWDATAIEKLLAAPGGVAFFTRHGFVLARVAGGEAEILTLAVTPEARGQGLGRVLLAAAAGHASEKGAENIFLEVGADNPAAVALYAGLGFARVGQRKAYYQGKDALVLKARLPLSLTGDFA